MQTYPESSKDSIARKMGVIRGFASYWKTFDPKTEIPPAEISKGTYRRSKPYIYKPSEIQKISFKQIKEYEELLKKREIK